MAGTKDLGDIGMESLFQNTVSPWQEICSWETLWGIQNFTQKSISLLFKDHGAKLPSEALQIAKRGQLFDVGDLEKTVSGFLQALKSYFAACISGTFQYPRRLRQAKYPLELFYYRGDIGYLDSRCVSIVGARSCSKDGAARAARLARELVARDYTVVSGLAAGIDTAAMDAAVKHGGRTVGVIGTPLNQYYPPENSALQDLVGNSHLLISQVPFYRYAHEHYTNRRIYFPQRNETMAALSKATVIVEAGETSGTLTQARACMHQGRKLFILNSCFESGLKWPYTYERQGAIRVRDMDDILSALEADEDGATGDMD